MSHNPQISSNNTTKGSPPLTLNPDIFDSVSPVDPREIPAQPTLASPKKMQESLKAYMENAAEQDDNHFDIEQLAVANGYTMKYAYSLRSYVEYTMALNAITILATSVFDYFKVINRHVIKTGRTNQKEMCGDSYGSTIIDGTTVSCTVEVDLDAGTLFVYFHSLSKKALKTIVKKYDFLFTSKNFYKGKHLLGYGLNRSNSIEFLEHPEPVSIYGFEKELSLLENHVVKFFDFKEIHQIAPQTAICLWGNPGSGKSSIVRWLKRACLEKGITVVELSTDAQRDILEWYRIIEQLLAPALVILEDFDLVGAARELAVSSTVTTDLLQSLGGNQKRKNVIVTVATTNRLSALDSAVMRARRIDKIIEINGLAPQFKVELFKKKGIKLEESILLKAAETLGKDSTGTDVEQISVSTLVDVNCGMSMEAAFFLNLKQWEDTRKTKANIGFNTH